MKILMTLLMNYLDIANEPDEAICENPDDIRSNLEKSFERILSSCNLKPLDLNVLVLVQHPRRAGFMKVVAIKEPANEIWGLL